MPAPAGMMGSESRCQEAGVRRVSEEMPAEEPAGDGTSRETRMLCRICYGSGELRVQRSALLPSSEIMGGTAIVLAPCRHCAGDGWLTL